MAKMERCKSFLSGTAFRIPAQIPLLRSWQCIRLWRRKKRRMQGFVRRRTDSLNPVRGGSSVGVTFTTGYAPLHTAVTGLFAQGAHGALAEECLKGTEATAGVVEGLRGEALYALPPIE